MRGLGEKGKETSAWQGFPAVSAANRGGSRGMVLSPSLQVRARGRAYPARGNGASAPFRRRSVSILRQRRHYAITRAAAHDRNIHSSMIAAAAGNAYRVRRTGESPPLPVPEK